DSPLVEITDLAVDKGGNIFAAAAGEARIQRTTRRTSTGTSEQDDNNENSDNDENVLDLPTQTITATGAARVSTQKSELYKVESDGTVRTFWTSNSVQIYSVILDDSDNIILGTGDPGRIYSLNAFGQHTLLTEFDELQITSLGKDSRANLLVCTSNPGNAYRLYSNFRERGEYLSEVIDASVSSQWGSMSWEADVGGNGELTFYTRTGNTEEPDKTWSPWSEPLTNSKGQLIQSQPARFIQFKARLSSENGKQTPVLREVICSYLQKNIAPEIRGIRIHEPGEYYPESTQQVSTDSHLGNDGTSNGNGSQNNHPGRKTFRKGGRSVSWQAQDENGDNLAFDVYYKGTDEQNWKTLVTDLHGVVYSWDSELLPDGRYVIKVAAKDEPSNPPALSLSSEKISQPFEVDNMGPKVSDIEVKTQKKTAIISFLAEDEMTNIRSVYYGLNAEDWRLVYPTDGICDSKSETFEITTDALVQGSNTIVIKAVDTIGNIGFGKTLVTP
nr:hypothetical protein [candidate division KSB1 bacterium]NIR72619.1 hypothetical protein [candidate division KSB1 bacterium]NIS23673.1 hypothetical protein [candidate division KSB1 bacterium]NIT70883.1 hypothetical protein [candidate division KSB1 bacterium]NIU24315.1 hypothetical protein [candidate division KSB1 bacterium]